MNGRTVELIQGLQVLGISASIEVQQKLLDYTAALEKWNRVYNLVAEGDVPYIINRHILDSLSISPFVTGNNILDVGTGAGLPGIPLALLNTDKQFTLLDSNHKKTRFLQQICHDLVISNCHVVNMRAENFKPTNCFDNIVSRAFASLDNMVAVTRHLICPNGSFLAMKGKIPTEELAALSEAFTIQLHELTALGSEAARHLIILKGK